MSLVEALASIAVGTVLLIGLNEMIGVSIEDAKGQQAALQHAAVVEAAGRYINANYADLITRTAALNAVEAVNVARLRNDGFLPNAFVDSNAYEQSTCVLVRQSDNQLDALVVSYGGRPIPEQNLHVAAMTAGPGAGYISKAATGVAKGPSWRIDLTASPFKDKTCGGGTVEVITGAESDAGHLVSNLLFSFRTAEDFLYRDNVGRPELNRMNTPLQLASEALVDAGTACGAQVALAVDRTSKDLVVCAGGVWKQVGSNSPWKETVPNYAALLATEGVTGDVRVTRNTGRAFVYRAGNWQAIAIDQNGDFQVPRDLAVARDETIERNLIVKGDVDARGDVKVAGDLNGEGWVHGRWTGSDIHIFDQQIAPGARCNIRIVGPDGSVDYENVIGSVGVDSNGTLVSCQTGNTFRYGNGKVTP